LSFIERGGQSTRLQETTVKSYTGSLESDSPHTPFPYDPLFYCTFLIMLASLKSPLTSRYIFRLPRVLYVLTSMSLIWSDQEYFKRNTT